MGPAAFPPEDFQRSGGNPMKPRSKPEAVQRPLSTGVHLQRDRTDKCAEESQLGYTLPSSQSTIKRGSAKITH